MSRTNKLHFIEAMLNWFASPSMGRELDVKFLSDTYDEITAPAWVSVEEEPYPPKKNKWDEQSEEVLVYGLWCGEPTMAFGEYYYDIHEWGLKGLMSDVTHWMQITLPVKKGGNDAS